MPRNKHSGNAKRFWSEGAMMELVVRNSMPYTLKVLRELSSPEWDELGDWLYYRCNPNEKDPRRNRAVPALPAMAGYN